jgi:hypothetical protein
MQEQSPQLSMWLAQTTPVDEVDPVGIHEQSNAIEELSCTNNKSCRLVKRTRSIGPAYSIVKYKEHELIRNT